MGHERTRPATNFLVATPWVLGSLVTSLAVYAWGSSIGWQVAHVSLYQWFPLLGLVAFSLMWSHYVVGLLSRTLLASHNLARYFSWTGYIVLLAILLHPGLLAYQRLRDGFGLPPGSETSYVSPGMAWLVVLGMISLGVFLTYELRRWFQARNWWRYVVYAGDVAMLVIFYHSLELGTQTHIGWYRSIWWFYGLSLLMLLVLAYVGPYKRVISSVANEHE